MSTWIKSHQSLREHPKTRKLAKRLGGLPKAIGHLHCLWWWAMDYAPDGDLTKFDAEDIAIGAEWEGEPEKLIEHLVACGFLENGDGLCIHDWWEYGEALIAQREANRERARAAYEKKKAADRQSTRRLRADSAKSAGLDRKRDRKKENAREDGPVDNSTIRPASRVPEDPALERLDWKAAADAIRTHPREKVAT